MIHTLEAMIGATFVILTIVLLSAYVGNSSLGPEWEMKRATERVLLALANDRNFRNAVLATDTNSELETVRNILANKMQYPFEIAICDTNSCISDVSSTQQKMMVSYLFDGNETLHNPKEVRIYVLLPPK